MRKSVCTASIHRRFLNRDTQGNEFAFHGVYHEVLAPERIIDTFEFEGLPETEDTYDRLAELLKQL